MTLLELTVVILVLLSLIITLFIGAQAWKDGSDKASCILNIRNVQNVIRSYQNLNGLDTGTPMDVAGDLTGPGNFIQSLPVCPASGTYTYASAVPPIGTLAVSCSLATSDEHVPQNFAGW
jgi:type II secretory pathway pseudopilin PulG